MGPNPQETADLVTLTEEIINGTVNTTYLSNYFCYITNLSSS